MNSPSSKFPSVSSLCSHFYFSFNRIFIYSSKVNSSGQVFVDSLLFSMEKFTPQWVKGFEDIFNRPVFDFYVSKASAYELILVVTCMPDTN